LTYVIVINEDKAGAFLLRHSVVSLSNNLLRKFLLLFLLLARYVPNVGKTEEGYMRTMYYWGSTTDQRPTDLAFWQISNGHISATGHPIHFMFGSGVGFSRSADRMSLLPVGPNRGR